MTRPAWTSQTRMRPLESCIRYGTLVHTLTTVLAPVTHASCALDVSGHEVGTCSDTVYTEAPAVLAVAQRVACTDRAGYDLSCDGST